MRFSLFIFIAFFSPLAFQLHASAPVPTAAKVTRLGEDLLVLPAPQNLVVTGSTTTSISLQWDPVPGAIDYMIQTILVGTPLSIASATANTQITITNLLPETDYEFRVSGRDNNLQPGDEAIVFFSTDSEVIIIEIVIKQGIVPNTPICSLGNSAGTCVLEVNKYYRGELFLTGNPARTSSFLFIGNPGLPVKFYPRPAPFSNFGTMAHIATSPTEVCNNQNNVPRSDLSIANCGGSPFSKYLKFSATQSQITGVLKFKATFIAPGFTLVIYEISEGARQGIIDASSTIDSDEIESRFIDPGQPSPIVVTAAPVPFSDYLSLNIEGLSENDNIAIDLFDMNGSLHRSMTHAAIEAKSLSLETADLPCGIYYLRTISGRSTQVLKLVKGNQ